MNKSKKYLCLDWCNSTHATVRQA